MCGPAGRWQEPTGRAGCVLTAHAAGTAEGSRCTQACSMKAASVSVVAQKALVSGTCGPAGWWQESTGAAAVPHSNSKSAAGCKARQTAVAGSVWVARARPGSPAGHQQAAVQQPVNRSAHLGGRPGQVLHEDGAGAVGGRHIHSGAIRALLLLGSRLLLLLLLAKVGWEAAESVI